MHRPHLGSKGRNIATFASVILALGVAIFLLFSEWSVRPLGESAATADAPPLEQNQDDYRVETRPRVEHTLHEERAEDVNVADSPGRISGRVFFDDWLAGDGLIDVSLTLIREHGTKTHHWKQVTPGSRFRFGEVAPGTYIVRASLRAARASTERITLAAGGAVDGIELRLESTDTTLEGYALEPDGTPVPGAVIRIAAGMATLFGQGDTATDSTGYYVFRHLFSVGPGQTALDGVSRYHLYPSKDGYHPQKPQSGITLLAGETRRIDIVLVPGKYTLTGVVVTESGNPVDGIALRAGEQSAVSRSDGTFEFAGLLEPCAVTVDIEDGARWSHPIPKQHDFFGRGDESGVVFTLAEGGKVIATIQTATGENFNARSIQLDDGVRAKCEPIEGRRTYASGTPVSFTGVETGKRTLFIQSVDKIHSEYFSQPFNVRPGRTTDLGAITLSAGGRFEGTVSFTDGGPALETVELKPEEHWRDRFASRILPDYDGRSDPNEGGRFAIAQIAPGNYIAAIQNAGVEQAITIREGEATRFDFVIPPQKSTVRRTEHAMGIRGNAALAGTVRWDDGAPVSGAEWSVGPYGSKGETDSSGSFRAEGLRSDETYRLEVEVKGDFRIRHRAEYTPREDVVVMLNRPVIIAGTLLRRSDNQPIQRAAFTLFANGERQQSTIRLHDGGRFSGTAQVNGPSRLTIEGDRFQMKTIERLRPSTGGRIELGTIRVEDGITILGTVVNAENEPIPLANVAVWPDVGWAGASILRAGWEQQSSVRTARTDSNGHFQLAHCQAGANELQVQATGYLDLHEQITARSGEPITIVMNPAGRIHGVVTNATRNGRLRYTGPDETMSGDVEYDHNGHFTIESLIPGTYTISWKNHELARIGVVVGETAEVALALP